MQAFLWKRETRLELATPGLGSLIKGSTGRDRVPPLADPKGFLGFRRKAGRASPRLAEFLPKSGVELGCPEVPSCLRVEREQRNDVIVNFDNRRWEVVDFDRQPEGPGDLASLPQGAFRTTGDSMVSATRGISRNICRNILNVPQCFRMHNFA